MIKKERKKLSKPGGLPNRVRYRRDVKWLQSRIEFPELREVKDK